MLVRCKSHGLGPEWPSEDETVKVHANIDKTPFPGESKLFIDLPPDVFSDSLRSQSPKAEKLARTTSSYIKKGLGLQRCLSLYGNMALTLTGLRWGSTSPWQSQDTTMSSRSLPTGRKWNPAGASENRSQAQRCSRSSATWKRWSSHGSNVSLLPRVTHSHVWVTTLINALYACHITGEFWAKQNMHLIFRT